MEKKVIDHTKINGWGIDADPENEPTYPIKKYTGEDHERKNWLRPVIQNSEVEVLMSTERPYLSAVYGTSNPPSGLSGAIRRMAFKHSENMYRHWLPLIVADRVNVMEGIVQDLFSGKIPNVFAERGWGAIARHRPGLLTRKIAVRVLVLGTIAASLLYAVKRNK